MSTYLSSQRKIKVEPKWIHRRRKESSRDTGRASFKTRVPGGAKHAHTVKALRGEDHRKAAGDRSHQHWPGAFCFHFTLSCILASQGGFNHQLLFDTSTTCPAFISLHSRLKTQSESLQLGQLRVPGRARHKHATGPSKERKPASQAQVVSPPAGSAEPVGWEGMPARASLQGCYYCSENGRFPHAGQRKTNPNCTIHSVLSLW